MCVVCMKVVGCVAAVRAAPVLQGACVFLGGAGQHSCLVIQTNMHSVWLFGIESNNRCTANTPGSLYACLAAGSPAGQDLLESSVCCVCAVAGSGCWQQLQAAVRTATGSSVG